MFYPQVPNTAKLLRLSFHDCAPYIREDGEVHGGAGILSIGENICTLLYLHVTDC